VLVPLLRRLGVSLDALVVSHADSDHSGGAESVLAAFGRARYLSSHGPGPGPLSLGRQGLAEGGVARCEAGQAWEWEGVRLTVLHPGPEDRARWPEGNALSCVLLVDNGHHSALLTGDIGIDQEVALAARHPTLAVDLLVAAHHGSRSSSSPVWLNQLIPRWVVVQAGHHNRFGHPAPEVLARYEARGATWVASPSCGLAAWRSSEPGRLDCWRQVDRRYWQHGMHPQAAPPPDEHTPEDPP
jgi:competence protein ComEC